MKSVINKFLTSGTFVLVIFYLVASGCSWISFTAENQVRGTIVLSGAQKPGSIYLTVNSCQREDGQSATDACRQVLERMESASRERGWRLAASGKEADLSVRMDIRFYQKKAGSEYYLLGLFPMSPEFSGLRSVEGMQVNVAFLARDGKVVERKRYRLYDEASIRPSEFARILFEDIVSAR